MRNSWSNQRELKDENICPQACSLLSEHGFSGISLKAAAQLYANRVSFGVPHYSNMVPGLDYEISTTNDWNGVMDLLDTLLKGFTYSKSCGLARKITFSDPGEMMEFNRRLSVVIAAGCIAFNDGFDVRKMRYRLPPHLQEEFTVLRARSEEDW